MENMNHRYSISCTSGFYVTSDAIVGEFANQGKAVPDYLAQILRHGIRYSFEDFDTLSAAMRELAPLSEAKALWERIGTKI